MAEITIDISGDEEEAVTVSNEHLSNFTIATCGVSLEVRFEQLQGFYDAIRPFFEEDT